MLFGALNRHKNYGAVIVISEIHRIALKVASREYRNKNVLPKEIASITPLRTLNGVSNTMPVGHKIASATMAILNYALKVAGLESVKSSVNPWATASMTPLQMLFSVLHRTELDCWKRTNNACKIIALI